MRRGDHGWTQDATKTYTHGNDFCTIHPSPLSHTCNSHTSSFGIFIAVSIPIIRKFTPPHRSFASVASFPSGKITHSFGPFGVKGRTNSLVHSLVSSRNSPNDTSILPGLMGNSISSCSRPSFKPAWTASMAFCWRVGGKVGRE